MRLYLRNQQVKTCTFTISFELRTLFEKVQKVVKKGTLNMKVYYIIPLNCQLIGHPENFKIKPCYFTEGLSLQYNITLKLLSLFHMCFWRSN